MKKMTLIAEGIAKGFPGKDLWKPSSFTLTGGAMMAITGVSGSGKTTLLNCIGQLEDFDAGAVTFAAGEHADRRRAKASVRKTQQRELFRSTLGFLFQNYGLVENWNVRRNVEIAANVNPAITRADKQARIAEALARVGMAGTEKTKVYTLSGGEQQRVALARLMLKAPAVILADEPTSALDAGNADLVMQILREQADAGALVLISTHSEAVARLCEHRIVMTPGQEITLDDAASA
ncbi:MAG: ATP-binding cassette domain-containing protein [Bowdeniella nasicola]|nr:ATP-binding cassette domain-containing protein [Bowdeniella nasicola]